MPRRAAVTRVAELGSALAPIIRRVGKDAHVLASYQGDPVLVEEGRHLVATFHPELTDDPRIHLIFLDKIP